jgi:hypothetical protein
LETKTKLQGCRPALGGVIGAALMLFGAGGLQAAGIIWGNGALDSAASNNYPCDSTCGSGSTFTVFDNFTVQPGRTWQVSGFDYTDVFAGGIPTSEYQSTTWTLWAGDPLSSLHPGTVVASSTTVTSADSIANLSSSCIGSLSNCSTNLITVLFKTLVTLTGGQTYYLGTSTVAKSSGDQMLRAFSLGGNTAPGIGGTSLANWEISNGSSVGTVGSTWTNGTTNSSCVVGSGASNNCSSTGESFTAFDILTPEPGTLTLFGIALSGLCFLRRRKAA